MAMNAVAGVVSRLSGDPCFAAKLLLRGQNNKQMSSRIAPGVGRQLDEGRGLCQMVSP
jgi:hypothetical protein